jgi:GTP-binding protein
MIIKSAKFIISNTDITLCPPPDKPEYAFIGRSNVGKSSLINMLTMQSKLASTSSKPGKTQLINHFLINNEWYLVDLPGYGWAKVSQEKRKLFEQMIKDYILQRENLRCLFVLIDSRIPPQAHDLEFVNWLGEKGVPFSIIFTKIDKQSRNKTNISVNEFIKKLKESWEELPTMFRTSSLDATGREQILEFIVNINQES